MRLEINYSDGNKEYKGSFGETTRVESGSADAVLYTPQDLDRSQKTQARRNIDANFTTVADFWLTTAHNDDDIIYLLRNTSAGIIISGNTVTKEEAGASNEGMTFPAIFIPGKFGANFEADFSIIDASGYSWTGQAYLTTGKIISLEKSETDYSLGISGASSGCMPVIKTVDSNGKPTSYNALSILDYANDIIGKSITLELQSATVGQIAKIKAVDSNGKPTEWEAVDMPDVQIPVVSKTSSDTAIELSPNTFYVFPEMASLSVTFSSPVSFDIVNEYKFRFISGATSTTLTLPSTVVGDITVEANKVYEISVVDNYLVYQSWAVS